MNQPTTRDFPMAFWHSQLTSSSILNRISFQFVSVSSPWHLESSYPLCYIPHLRIVWLSPKRGFPGIPLLIYLLIIKKKIALVWGDLVDTKVFPSFSNQIFLSDFRWRCWALGSRALWHSRGTRAPLFCRTGAPKRPLQGRRINGRVPLGVFALQRLLHFIGQDSGGVLLGVGWCFLTHYILGKPDQSITHKTLK